MMRWDEALSDVPDALRFITAYFSATGKILNCIGVRPVLTMVCLSIWCSCAREGGDSDDIVLF